MKIIQIYSKLDNFGGAQKIICTLHHEFRKKGYDAHISSLTNYDNIFFKHKIDFKKYILFSLLNINKFNNSLILSHHRKITTLLIILKKTLKLNFRIIHISHSVFNNYKHLTLYPKNIIAVSEAVKFNLLNFFNINFKSNKINVIHNGLHDRVNRITIPQINGDIYILLAGRIDDIKQQIFLFNYLRDKIQHNVHVHFAGNGPQSDELKSLVTNHSQFKYLGFQQNIPKLLEAYHFSLLFSKQEGLGLTLIESCMAGRPIIAKCDNNSAACGEVCIDNYNGFHANTPEHLLSILEYISKIDQNKYEILCKNSRIIYERKFQISTMINKYIDIIETI